MNADLLRSFDSVASRIDAAGARCVGFSSTLAAEGTTTIALGTALALGALRQERVLVVDANWIDPSLTADAGLSAAPGLADHLAKRVDIASVVRSLGAVDFLPIGDREAARPTLRAIAAFVAADAARYPTVVVDLPPILVGEAYVLPWTTALDRMFVVLREGATPLALARRALEKVAIASPEVVLNRAPAPSAAVATALIAARRAQA